MPRMSADGATAVGAARPSRSASWAWWRGLRVRDWAHFVVLPLAAAPLRSPDAAAAIGLARGMGIAALLLAYGYLLNGLADRGLDRDPAKNPFSQASTKAIDALAALAFALALGALGLAAAGGPVPVAAASTSIAAGWLYSAGPRLKRLPIVGTLLNVACFAPLLFVGAGRTLPPATALLTLAFTGLLLENQLLHEAADARDDAAAQVRTTFLALGARGAAALAAFAGTLPAAAIGLAWPGAIGACVAGATALVFVVVVPRALARHGADPRRMARARLLHRAAGVALGALLFAVAGGRG